MTTVLNDEVIISLQHEI